MTKKTFRVYAKNVSYSYMDIEANSAEEAEQMAEDSFHDGEDEFQDVAFSDSFELAPSDRPTVEVGADGEPIFEIPQLSEDEKTELATLKELAEYTATYDTDDKLREALALLEAQAEIDGSVMADNVITM
jgi:hypothetical protein